MLAAPARPKRRRLALRWVAVPLLAGAAAAVVVAFAPTSDKAPAVLNAPPANAAEFLSQLQGKAAQAPAQPGRYAYIKQIAYISHMRPRAGGHGSYVMVVPHEFEQWMADDGSGVVKEVMHEDQATFPTARDKADWEKAAPPPEMWNDSPRKIDDAKIAGLTVAQVQALPTDPDALRAQLSGGDISLTAMCGILLSSAATPQDVKVALFSVLKSVPGAKLDPDVTDPTGRKGIGVVFDDPAWHTEFLFDPETGMLLGTRSVGHKELPGRDIDDWSLIVASHRTDTAPATAR